MTMNPKSLSGYQSEYEQNGVVRIPGVFDLAEVDLLRGAAMFCLSKLDAIASNGYKHKALETITRDGVEFPALLFWPALADDHLNKIRCDQRLVQIVNSLLGPNVKQLNNQIYFRFPGDSDSFAWHQDIMFRSPRDCYPNIVEDNAYLQTAIIVDKIDSDNSPIIFVLGSHKLGELQLVPENYDGLRGFIPERKAETFKHLEQKAYTAEPGDVLLWSALTVHGSERNQSRKPRMYYMNGFAKSENCIPWPDFLSRNEVTPINAAKIP